MKSTIRVYNETKFLGYFVGVHKESEELKISNHLLNAKLFDSEEKRQNQIRSLWDKFPGKTFV